MKRCRLCVIPDTRPDTQFVDGVCSACRSYAARPEIDWAARKRDLELLLERGRNSTGFDCIVPSSGGKDSTWQALQLIAMGARPLLVTATTCHLTGIGRLNIDNLKRYATTIEVSPNKRVRALLNRFGLETVGDVSWPEHASIFTTPFRIAASLGIPLIFYGENPQNQYGGPPGSDQARQMTARWVSEFGGFLGQYLPWDSHENARQAKAAGMVQVLPSDANWWHHENLDNAQTGLHDHSMYRKYGYGRLAAQLAVDIRAGRIKREEALEFVRWRDGTFPREYMGVAIEDVLARIDVMPAKLMNTLERFTSWELFEAEAADGRPILKEGA